MPYRLRITTGFTRKALECFLDSTVNDDFIIAEATNDARDFNRQSVMIAFSNATDRDRVQSLFGVRGHRLAPRNLRAGHYNAVA